MVTKKNYHHGDLRRKLLDTALKIISEHGLEKVSMRGLGVRLGVSRTAPYRHFAGKSALLCAIAEDGYKKLTKAMNQKNQQLTDDPVTRLNNTGIAYVEFAIANPVHYRIMFGNEILENDRTPELVTEAEKSFNELLFAVKVCQEEKFVKPLNPHIIANLLWSMTHGISTLLIDGQIQAVNAFKGRPALIQSEDGSGRVDVQKIFEAMGGILLTGILL
ncbi:MAG: TetR/AcrR family transcriptional regulator [Desulfobacteraceae bacterium]|nr:TetR/AcrR family transcriptional regulator [Desulfobacteraceae bacterium]